MAEESHEAPPEAEDPPQFGSTEWRIQKGITVRRAAWGQIVNEVLRRDNPHAYEPVSEEEARKDASGFKAMARRLLDEPIRKKNRAVKTDKKKEIT